MAMNVTPFQSTDEFTMDGFNGKIAAVNSNVDSEIASALTGFARIETGSYVGTGTYGADNPNTLTFGFVPKLVFIFGFYPTNDPHPNGYNGTFDVTSLNEEYKKYGYLINDWSNVSDSSHAKMSGHTLSWYSSSSNNSQLNSNGAHYSYIAIG